MAQATTTTLGEIVLAGDLCGSGMYPELVSTGVIPGTYAPVQKLTVDSKGRVIAVGQTTEAELLAAVGDATPIAKGVASVGTNLLVSSAAISVPTATSAAKGAFSLGSGLKIVGGEVQLDFPSIIATDTVLGLITIGTGFEVVAAVLNPTVATGSVLGAVKSGANITNTAGVLSLEVATGAVLGLVKSGANITNTAGVFSIADATDSVKGVFTVGTGLSVAAGVVSVDTSTVLATGSTYGFAKLGPNFILNGSNLDLPLASGITYGVAKIFTNFVNTGGVISIPDATAAVKGVFTLGTGLSVAAGAVSVDPTTLPVATDVVFGVVQSGVNITNTAGVLSIADATTAINGVFSVSTGLQATAGAVTLNLDAIPATGAALGFVKSGTNITNTTGTLSIPDGTSSVKGVAQYAIGSGLSAIGGVVRVNGPDFAAATESTFGVVIVPTSMMSSGSVVLPVATGASLGMVRPSTNFTISGGVLSIEDASTTVKGVASFSNTNFSVSAGAVSLSNTPVRFDTTNTFFAAQNATSTALTSIATLTPNFQTDSGTTDITLDSNLTINFPTTLAPVGTVVRTTVILRYSAGAAYTVTLSGTYKTNRVLPFTNAAVDKYDVLNFICTNSVCYATLNEGFIE